MPSTTPATAPGARFWQRKLAAFLHDPPAKCLDIPGHLRMAEAAARRAGLTDDDNRVALYHHSADHKAAAADRLPFPPYPKISCGFGVNARSGRQSANTFHHLLDGAILDAGNGARTGEFEPTQNDTQPAPAIYNLDELFPSVGTGAERARANFFLHWRLWRQHAVERDWRFDFLPADTRIPDHSIWSHIQVVSSLESTAQNIGADGRSQKLAPAFLKFQLGPVQDFIAAARSTRDLWSGSYLLSWLMSAGLAKIAELAGPDAVIFPNLHAQPLFDLRFRDALWDRINSADGQNSLWETSVAPAGDDALRTPNLPNVFLALVPAGTGAEIARAVESAIRDEWQKIAGAVWNFCDGAKMFDGDDTAGAGKHELRRARFQKQIGSFLSLAWQITPFPDTLDDAEKLAGQLPANETQTAAGTGEKTPSLLARFREVRAAFENKIPADDRDSRYYFTDKDGTVKLNNEGLAWSLIVALNAWQLDAVRQTRNFAGTGGGGEQRGTGSAITTEKDSLTGALEAVVGGKKWNEHLQKTAREPGDERTAIFQKRFPSKHADDFLSAPTLVKRLWDIAYLAAPKNENGTGTGGCALDCFKNGKFPMPNTRGLAMHEPLNDTAEADAGADDAPKYFAVLAFDGDQIGKWISGENAPVFQKQLANYAGTGGEKRGSLPYFEDPKHSGKFQKFLDTRRLVSPSYHLQFSETLSNFALHFARPVVEHYNGRLIYAGGDDVLALLPADTAPACAHDLRSAFRGERCDSLENAGDEFPAPGFIKKNLRDNTGRNYTRVFTLPGPAADASVGIAIAHYKAPLQDIVRTAQAAEKRAKNKCNRSAVGITLMKRSGEILEWDNKWDWSPVPLHDALVEAMAEKENSAGADASAKLPHRIIALLEPYLSKTEKSELAKMENAAGFDAAGAGAIAKVEIAHALAHQCDNKETREKLQTLFDNYIAKITAGAGTGKDATAGADFVISKLIGVCTAAAFSARQPRQQ
jgi:CRISPR-associated protein Cas10/Cmr2 subtype III-B